MKKSEREFGRNATKYEKLSVRENLFVSKKGLRLKENFQIEEISWVFFKATRNSQTRVFI